MPYILSPPIDPGLPALWQEGPPYETSVIYDRRPQEPPVRYRAHTLRPHSLPHLDAPLHTEPDGEGIESYFGPATSRALYGPAAVVKLDPPAWRPVADQAGAWHWEVGRDDLAAAVARVTGVARPPEKLLLTAHDLPLDGRGQHDHAYALTLSPAAADWLVAAPRFNAFGTSYKSADFQPGRRERPIHTTLFRQAAIFECLDLTDVPEGEYFLVAFTLRLAGASESPVTPVLFTAGELAGAFPAP